MTAVEKFIGNPSDKTLYGDTPYLFINRMKRYPDTAITDLGYPSPENLKTRLRRSVMFSWDAVMMLPNISGTTTVAPVPQRKGSSL
ncbi:hypothetical protein QUF90_23030 [Desulfococcaceae bacterium HSG9]|nr:hypothetical protein [Desulfococcaceae bacterium HSG9]